MTVLAPEETQVTPETTTPMKPSEAIRLGAMATKQSFGSLMGANQHGTFACAIGAAAYAYGWKQGSGRTLGDRHQNIYDKFTDLFPRRPYIWSGIQCPVSGEYCDSERKYENETHYNYEHLVMHMNDKHMLPREWIADFLESIGF